MPKGAPKKRKHRTQQRIRFNEKFFSERRWWFKPEFLSKSPVEKSVRLAKIFVKTTVTRNQLAGLYRDLILHEEKLKGNPSPKDMEQLERAHKMAHNLWDSLVIDVKTVFSQEYWKSIHNNISRPNTGQHGIDFHECSHLMQEIQQAYIANGINI